jgi:hypothetical protein
VFDICRGDCVLIKQVCRTRRISQQYQIVQSACIALVGASAVCVVLAKSERWFSQLHVPVPNARHTKAILAYQSELLCMARFDSLLVHD